MKPFLPLIFAVLLIDNLRVSAQEKDSAQTSTLPFTVGINYYSKSVYAGRDFGVSQYAVAPYLKYKHKTGLYGMVSGSWLSESTPSYSSTNFELGFEKDLFSFMDFSANYDRMFVNRSSNVPTQPVSNMAGITATFYYKFLSLYTGYMYAFGHENGQGITLSLSGTFSKKLKSFVNTVSISPTIETLMGNSNIVFSQLTINQYENGEGANFTREVGKDLKSTPGVPIPIQPSPEKITITGNPFGILNYELSLPVVFSMKNLSLFLSYNYSIPQKVSSVEDVNLKNLSTTIVGLSYKF